MYVCICFLKGREGLFGVLFIVRFQFCDFLVFEVDRAALFGFYTLMYFLCILFCSDYVPTLLIIFFVKFGIAVPNSLLNWTIYSALLKYPERASEEREDRKINRVKVREVGGPEYDGIEVWKISKRFFKKDILQYKENGFWSETNLRLVLISLNHNCFTHEMERTSHLKGWCED